MTEFQAVPVPGLAKTTHEEGCVQYNMHLIDWYNLCALHCSLTPRNQLCTQIC